MSTRQKLLLLCFVVLMSLQVFGADNLRYITMKIDFGVFHFDTNFPLLDEFWYSAGLVWLELWTAFVNRVVLACYGVVFLI